MTVQDPRAEQTIELSVRQPAAGVSVLAVSGEVDMVSAPTLRDALVNGLADGGTFVVDMTGVTFLGSAGLAVLVEAARLAPQHEAALKVVAKARAVTRPLEATGLGEVFSIHESVDAALS
ncbi:STAS domain-containing protein [Lentzea sp. BCCO 10_0856]|uniref:Anti-sigma factor antagonist n=1 Tax=Lentzea miocenica TaxID=3095431 RepID=A0ABU4TGA6_9PSEU|nr:STAS domain-containing protein [Lentzea sp. BCCO 10_0856]MDX8037198.1 STAS domain-containing protein [Lentzea sp. BCCO 10_0856]